jgi:hypothetical protein
MMIQCNVIKQLFGFRGAFRSKSCRYIGVGYRRGKKSPEGDLMLSNNVDLNVAITNALSENGLLYTDKKHSHSSTRTPQYISRRSKMKQHLISSSSISGHYRKNQLLDLVTIYETMLSITDIRQEHLISGSTAESASYLSIDPFCQLLYIKRLSIQIAK